ncbi:hypothetical protein RhiirA5_435577 [Rhizophagus irregularis]|uniref:3CxxC-type domain-containing protein n=1 Tax=Rhizophagus irregularis TaxID=588596 RepID=A0A2I1DT96_9GLOM|nr:hypothetical protein RhiirA5_435577 [Rhizophagus irregularis]PKC54384.1 hypothetical protein RhiirA1_477423 [Rhizophagus irregularis]PKY13102.1 hypothetical protein RhiirB3_424848 [Rhizophagus irregularis]CAB4464993.1 unnamed protein product [Rhizophagus irregularis]CAB5379446.1 unnamed protein product [Rhizophagus irregularis]
MRELIKRRNTANVSSTESTENGGFTELKIGLRIGLLNAASAVQIKHPSIVRTTSSDLKDRSVLTPRPVSGSLLVMWDGFNLFNEFLVHIESYHQISNLNFQEIFKGKEEYKQDIKFYWSLKCQCGHEFSFSLCNTELKMHGGNIEISKIYNLKCLKCEQIAKFDENLLLTRFLEKRFKQKLIYKYYDKIFEPFKFEYHSTKKLEGHIRSLCKKCQMSPTHLLDFALM